MSFARRLILFALAYWAGAELSYVLLEKAGKFSGFWPPAGIYLGMLLATPRRRWWAVVLAAAVPNLLSDVVVHQHSLLRGLGFLLVNLGAPLGAAALLVRVCRPAFSFARLAHIRIWILVVAALSTPLGAVGGAAIIVNTKGGTFLQKWFLWWVGDLLGVLALTPLAYGVFGASAWPQRTRVLEGAALLLSLAAATLFVFQWAESHALPPAVLFLFLMWAALRFGAAMVAAATTVLAIIALWLTGAGLGPYSFQMQPHLRALMVQMMAATGALLFYVLAAVMAEQRAAENELQQSNLRLDEQVKARTAELLAAHEQSRANEISLQLALASAQMGIHVWDLAAGTLHWDNRLRELWGIGPDDPVTYEVFRDGLHPDDRAATQAVVDRALDPASDGRYAVEYRVIGRNDGATRWIRATGQVFFADGKAVRLIGTARDITERKQAEDALQRQTALLNSINDNTSELIFMKDLQGRLMYCNAATLAVMGMSRAQAFGSEQAARYSHLEDLPLIHEADRRVAQTGTTIQLEEPYTNAAGERRIFLSTKSPLRNEAGQIIGVIGVSRDITERKRHEANLHFLAEVTSDFNRLTTPQEIMQAIGTRLGQFLGVKSCNFTQIDEARDEVLYLGQWNASGEPPLPEKVTLSAHVSEEFLRRVRAGETIISHNTQTNPITKGEENAKVGALAFITVPFHRGAAWHYLISVHDTTPRAWRADEIELVREVAQRVFPRLERAQAEAALQASHATFRHLVEQSPFGIYVVDADFRLALVGAGAQKVFTNVRPLLGRDFAEVLRVVWPEPFATEAINLFRHTLTTGEPYHSPRTIEQRGDIDEVEAYDWKIERITLPDGRFGVVCHFYDLSERQRFETILHESEARFRTMADNTPVMIWVTNANGEIEFVNRAYQDFFGVTEAQVAGPDGWQPLVHPEDYAAYLQTFLDTLRRHTSFIGECRVRHASGAWHWILSHGAPRFSASGEFLGHVGSSFDITARKELELEREQVLAREQQARQLAEDANRAKDDWLAMVTHELRSPLNAILGHARLHDLHRTQLTPEFARFVDLVRRNGERQNELINDLLDTARLATGKLQLEPAPVYLAEIVKEALEAVQASARAKDLHLWLELDDNLDVIQGDAVRLQQVVWNLLTNAVKFTPPGGAVIVSLRREPEQIVLTVSDTGQGIAPDFLRQVFDRFSQADNSRSRRHGGLGLGLALVKQIVELHGGTITAASDGEGQGATFTVQLPAPRKEPAPVPKTMNARAPGLRASAPLVTSLLHGVEVLLVEDDADMQTLLTTILRAEGAQVRSAESAALAWPWLTADTRPHVLICDIALPEEDGYSLLARLRQWEHDHDVNALPALALTALSSTRDRLQALSVGFQMHIAKPVDIEELLFVLQSLLERNRANEIAVSE